MNNVKLTMNKRQTKFDTSTNWELRANSQQVRENSNKGTWKKLQKI